jgi:hypothetical protein
MRMREPITQFAQNRRIALMARCCISILYKFQVMLSADGISLHRYHRNEYQGCRDDGYCQRIAEAFYERPKEHSETVTF